MKNPTYIQIDGSILGDSKIAVLLRRHGAVGLAVYLYSLIQINQSNVDSLHLDEGFTECASVVLDITKETLGKVIETLIGIGLLICDGEAYYSHGYTKRTGEYKEANRKRSESQKRNKAAEREGKEIEAVVLPLLPKPKRPLVAKNAITDIPETEEIKKLRESVNELVNLGKDATVKKPNNVCCTLSNAQFQKLIDKHGINDKTLRKYYLWKFGTDKSVKDDYLSILNNMEKGWLQNESTDRQQTDNIKRHF